MRSTTTAGRATLLDGARLVAVEAVHQESGAPGDGVLHHRSRATYVFIAIDAVARGVSVSGSASGTRSPNRKRRVSVGVSDVDFGRPSLVTH